MVFNGLVMKFFAAVLALFVLFVAQLPSYSQDAEKTYYYIVIKGGKDSYVKELTINNYDVLGGQVKSLEYPVNVTDLIQHGLNNLKFVSSVTDGLSPEVILEKRTKGPKKTLLEKIESRQATNMLGYVETELKFNIVKEEESNGKKKKLTTKDAKTIMSLINQYFEALEKKDVGTIFNLYAQAIKEEKKLRPKVSKLFEHILKKECKLLKNPKVEFKFLNMDKIQVRKNGDRIRVSSSDGSNLIESKPLEIELDEELLAIRDKKNLPKKAKMKLKKSSLEFEKTNEHWHLAIPASM